MKLWTDSSYPIILSCAKCLAPWVKREIEELGYKPIDETDNIVVVKGNMRDVLKLNLRVRTAHRVLVPLLRARCRHIRELYSHIASIDWENLIDADGYFSVSEACKLLFRKGLRYHAVILVVDYFSALIHGNSGSELSPVLKGVEPEIDLPGYRPLLR